MTYHYQPSKQVLPSLIDETKIFLGENVGDKTSVYWDLSKGNLALVERPKENSSAFIYRYSPHWGYYFGDLTSSGSISVDAKHVDK